MNVVIAIVSLALAMELVAVASTATTNHTIALLAAAIPIGFVLAILTVLALAHQANAAAQLANALESAMVVEELAIQLVLRPAAAIVMPVIVLLTKLIHNSVRLITE
jgi:hypothetical protein